VESERILATVLFTDIVGSTERAAELGDSRWRELLNRHHALVRRELHRFGGREINTAGDGFLATFDRPARAIRCACAIREAVRDLGLEIRGGVHMGEVEGEGKAVGGIAVHIGARVAAQAGASEVLVSSTVRDLVVGSGCGFEDRGVHVLKGVPGEWRLYAVSGLPEAAGASLPGRWPPRLTRRQAVLGGALFCVLLLGLAGLYLVQDGEHRAGAAPEAGAKARTAGSPAREKKSIAVLPFVNMSSATENEYFSDGMTEELINALTKVEGLRVASRTSAFAFKGKDADIRRIGEQLNVANVLEGSVRMAGNRLRITAQLIDVADGYHLWSETYEREMRDVFGIQDEISRAIVGALELKLGGEGGGALVERPTENLEAYNLYLKGRYFWNKRSEGGLGTAIEYFEQAIRMDSTFAAAYSGLADSYNLLRVLGLRTTEDVIPRERAAVLKALELDEGLPQAHTSLALLRFNYDWDWPGAEKEFKRAIELNPGDPNTHHWYSHLLMAMGRAGESLAESESALELAPVDVALHVHLGWHYLRARQYDQAVEQLLKALEMDPKDSLAHLLLGYAYTQKRMFEEALAEYREHTKVGGKSAGIDVIGYVYALSGRREEARQVLEDLKQAGADPLNVAALHAVLGEKDQAFEWLERAYEQRSADMVNLKVDPRLDGLRSDPRFKALLKRMHLDPRTGGGLS
jgi:adenylate cyclase